MNVVITGASRGIGLELTRQALAKGHTVIAVARQPEKSPGLVKLREEAGGRLQVLPLELTQPEAPAKMAAAVEKWPSVDVLINNAGIMRSEDTAKDFMDTFQINSVVPFLVTRALLPALRKSKQPKVVHITSLMGSIEDNTSGGYYSYRSSKSALNMINKSLSVDNKWLATIVMHPGWVKTEMGGPGAPTEPPESAAGIWKMIDGLSTGDSGGYFDFRGERLPW